MSTNSFKILTNAYEKNSNIVMRYYTMSSVGVTTKNIIIINFRKKSTHVYTGIITVFGCV